MPWNGSGVFARVYSWAADRDAGLDILADRMDTDTDDIAQGLMHSLTVNGETVPVANLPMANFRHTGASAGVATTDYATVGQVLNGGGGIPAGGFLPLTGGGAITGPLTVSGLLTASGGGAVTGPLTVSGALTPTGGVVGPLTVSSSATINGPLTVNHGALTATGDRILCTGNSPSVVVSNTAPPTASPPGGFAFGMWAYDGYLEIGAADASGDPQTSMILLDRSSELFLVGNLFPNVNAGQVCGQTGRAWGSMVSYAFTNASDARDKRDIADLPPATALVKALTPKRYRFNPEPTAPGHKPGFGAPRTAPPTGLDDGVHWGFLAQEVKAVMDQAGLEFAGHRTDAKTGRQGLNYHELLAVLWKAVQELSGEVEALRAGAAR